jgi:hypothetical protein
MRGRTFFFLLLSAKEIRSLIVTSVDAFVYGLGSVSFFLQIITSLRHLIFEFSGALFSLLFHESNKLKCLVQAIWPTSVLVSDASFPVW